MPPLLRKPSILAVSRDSLDFDCGHRSCIALLCRAPVASIEPSHGLGVGEKRGNFYVTHEPADRVRVAHSTTLFVCFPKICGQGTGPLTLEHPAYCAPNRVCGRKISREINYGCLGNPGTREGVPGGIFAEENKDRSQESLARSPSGRGVWLSRSEWRRKDHNAEA